MLTTQHMDRRPNRLDTLISKLELLHEMQTQQRRGSYIRWPVLTTSSCVLILLFSLFALCSTAAEHARMGLWGVFGSGGHSAGGAPFYIPQQVQALPPPPAGREGAIAATQQTAHAPRGVPMVSLFVHDALAAQIARSLPTLAFALSSLFGARVPAPPSILPALASGGTCFWAAAAVVSTMWLFRMF